MQTIETGTLVRSLRVPDMRRLALCASVIGTLGMALGFSPAHAEERGASGKLLLTGGVTQLEGSAGGGLTPWAIIGGYGTRDQIGANAFYTKVGSDDYQLGSYGALVGIFDRVELSVAEQVFNTQSVGTTLGLGRDFTFRQRIMGLKVKVAGDAVLEQNSWLPQIAVGLQHKQNNQQAIVRAVGAKRDNDTDYYLAATKLMLAQSTLVNVTVRATRANQTGLLGFGSEGSNKYRPAVEGSIAYLLSRNLAVGVEYRQKPNNLKFAKEQDWSDVFVAWAPLKNISATLAYARLGDIATIKNQHGIYGSVQVGF